MTEVAKHAMNTYFIILVETNGVRFGSTATYRNKDMRGSKWLL